MIDPLRFVEAAGNGDLETVRQYLRQPDAYIECRGYLNMTALLQAASVGHTDVVRVLVEHGADVHNAWYAERHAGTALEMAAEKGHAEIVDLLLAAGGEVNNPVSGASPALIGAAHGGHVPIVRRLLDAGANAHSVTGDKTTVLILLSGFGPNHALNPDYALLTSCMRTLIDMGVDVNAVDALNDTALVRAINANNEPIVQFLLDSGADPNLAASLMAPRQLVRYAGCLARLVEAGLKTDTFVEAIAAALLDGRFPSALSLASALPANIKELHTQGVDFVKDCLTDDLTLFAQHLNAHAGTDILAVYGGIALAMVIDRGRNRLQKARMLIEAGAEINLSPQNLGHHLPPLVKACRSGDLELIQLLVDHGADPNLGIPGSPTPLMLAYGADRLYDDRSFPAKRFNERVDQLAKQLIEAGADINAVTSEGLTALLIAIQRFPFNLDRLIEAGADVNAQSKYGWTALMGASPKNTKRLIEAGANVHITDTDGRTALFLSTMPTKADVLRKAGANPAQPDNMGMTPLMYHAQRGDLKMLRWFSKYKKNRAALDHQGNNAVLHALGNHGLVIIPYLVELGEDPTIVNAQGDSLFIKACRASNIDLIKLALSFHPNINATNKAGETGLMIACRYHDDGAVAKLLIRHGADPSLAGPDGCTALDIAARFKSAQAVRFVRQVVIDTQGKKADREY